MIAKLLLPLIAATFTSLSAYAHDCSGGADGGMDATGNQCNDVASVAPVVPSKGAAASSTRLPKLDVRRAAPCSTCAVKRTVATRRASERARIKHG